MSKKGHEVFTLVNSGFESKEPILGFSNTFLIIHSKFLSFTSFCLMIWTISYIMPIFPTPKTTIRAGQAFTILTPSTLGESKFGRPTTFILINLRVVGRILTRISLFGYRTMLSLRHSMEDFSLSNLDLFFSLAFSCLNFHSSICWANTISLDIISMSSTRMDVRHSSSITLDTLIMNLFIKSLGFVTKFGAYLDKRVNFKSYSLTLS